MRLPMSRLIAFCLCLALFAVVARANINVGRYDAVHIVPAPHSTASAGSGQAGPVTIDGDLDEWDRSGEFFTYRYEEQKDRFAVHGYMMYDAENLYIGAHIKDSTPMLNVCNPESEGAFWNGDCLQVRVSADRALGW